MTELIIALILISILLLSWVQLLTLRAIEGMIERIEPECTICGKVLPCCECYEGDCPECGQGRWECECGVVDAL